MESAKVAARALWGKTPAGLAFGGGAQVGSRTFFDRVLKDRSQHEQPWLFDLVPFASFRGKRVLEVGCGAGYDAYEISRNGARYTGIDIAQENAGRTREHLGIFGLEPRVAAADAEALPFRDASFDVVFSNGVLHHTPDMERSFREIRRVLAPGGEFFVVLYHRDSIFHWLNMWLADHVILGGWRRRTFKERLSMVESATSDAVRPLVNVYSRSQLRSILARAGFRVEKVAVRKLVRAEFPYTYGAGILWDRISEKWLERLSLYFGWYVFARARKRESERPKKKLHVNLTNWSFDLALKAHEGRGERDELLDYSGTVASSTKSPRRELVRAVRRSGEVAFYVDDLARRSLLDVLAPVMLLGEKSSVLVADVEGRARRLSLREATTHALRRAFYVALVRPGVRVREARQLEEVFHDLSLAQAIPARKGKPARIAFLRTDRIPALKAGGSVAHISGVVNAFLDEGIAVRVFSTAKIPTVRAPQEVIPIQDDLRDRLPGREDLIQAQDYARAVLPGLRAFAPDLLYWRHSRGGLAGALLSQWLRVPLVIEFNGSEVWVDEKWSKPGQARADLSFKTLLLKAEEVSFRLATRIVVVSDVLKDELVSHGVPREKVQVEPNAVDMDRFPREELDRGREAVRARLGFSREHTVCGFIGTFGKWHGAQVLAKAVRPALERFPSLRFLVIGDGLFMPEVRATLREDRVEDKVVLTGLVPQTESPALLNACDFYVSPHVPNDDGSRFFGSPTKIFEYMALGRGIVASSLDQIGEVLRDDETALLVPPGDLEKLVSRIVELARDPERRERLGRAARARVLERHTWRSNVRSLLASL